jgi:hypothetical protein
MEMALPQQPLPPLPRAATGAAAISPPAARAATNTQFPVPCSDPLQPALRLREARIG